MSEPMVAFKDGKFWVDTGHADVGPFDSPREALEHIARIKADKDKHDKELNENRDQ